MEKCYLCGKDCETTITINGYNHSEVICGKCAIEKEIIQDEFLIKLIRESEGLQEEQKRCCSNCQFLARKLLSSDKRFCNRYSVCLAENEIDSAVCDCHEYKQ